jgi:hypothetical protein
MIRMMSNENLSEYGGNGWVEVETIRTILEAAEKGVITIPVVRERGRGRPKKDGPEPGSSAHKENVPDSGTFSRERVAMFLGWTRKHREDCLQPNTRLEIAFDAVEVMRDGLVNEDQLRDLPRYPAV